MPITPSQLNGLGATLSNNEVVFNTPASADNYVCVLNKRGFVRIEGPDAEKFMQGQLTCDVTSITSTHSSLGAHCSPKGRAIASFRLVQTAEQQYLFGLPYNNTDTLLKSLGKYIVFSKASLSGADTICTLGLSGSNATHFIEATFNTPLNIHGCTTTADGTAICIDQDRFELWLNEAQLRSLWPSIVQQLTPSSTDVWYEQSINAQQVEIEAATSDELIPQMFKLEEHGGISFTKGCYTGQEIVARLKYLGKQKRQLMRFEHQIDTLNVGDTITNSDGKNLGVVVTTAATSGLAVVSNNALDGSTALVQGATIQLAHGE